ncbi:MAG: tryptophan--tRNA ligase [Hirschia sp.]|nr:tryptophan--tRNA ligase [Hirschia sp.]MBF18832.1 tryptophan--tRNA ligase [Hirschia sp.]|tara:strand:+ start:783 stop:1814 length:1032 start_codon:yes stop_codon:yes gene_type:complete
MSDDSKSYDGPERVFSGMQPSGDLHLGNYLGALINWVRLQDEHECVYCIVDMHAITVPQDPKKLASQTREIASAWLAAGIDPERAMVYAQSSVPAHAQLAWIFNCVARMGWVERMTQFKDKAGKDSERASVGLFTYPVLQAADILAFKGTHVPVGEDQKQHLELSRDIAEKFNRDFDAPGFFPQPEPLIQGPGARIMSLKDGTKKMSKSDPSDLSRINLIDDADTIAKKIKKAKSDSDALPSETEGLEGRPEAANLVGIYAVLAGQTTAQVLSEFGGDGFGRFKPALAELAVEKLSPITSAMRDYMADPAQVDRILEQGAARARDISEPILAEVRRIVGFWGS